jgi:hypothetical protein
VVHNPGDAATAIDGVEHRFLWRVDEENQIRRRAAIEIRVNPRPAPIAFVTLCTAPARSG